jgi:hypothetical protein
LTVTAVPSLHIPEEPTGRARVWLDAILEGGDLSAVLRADDGLVAWLWSRWSALGSAGLSYESFAAIVDGNRRELWLWLAGERTWTQACSGLLGRINRRIAAVDTPAG